MQREHPSAMGHRWGNAGVAGRWAAAEGEAVGEAGFPRRLKRRRGAMLSVAVSLLAIAATVLEVGDVLSTHHMLARGGREQNPIVIWFMQVLGDWWPLCKLPEIVVIAVLWAFAPRAIALICLGLMITGYGYVVWHNYHI